MSDLKVVTPPATEPVNLEEMKAFLKVDLPEEDALISSLIAAARRQAEAFMHRTLITTQYDLCLDPRELCGEIELPRGPHVSVDQVRYQLMGTISPSVPVPEQHMTFALDEGSRELTITPDQLLIDYTATDGDHRDQIISGFTTLLGMVAGEPYNADWITEDERAIVGAHGTVELYLTPGAGTDITSYLIAYPPELAERFLGLYDAIRGIAIGSSNTMMGMTPGVVFADADMLSDMYSWTADLEGREMELVPSAELLAYLETHIVDLIGLTFTSLTMLVGVPNEIDFVGDDIVLTGPDGSITLHYEGSMDVPTRVSMAYSSTLDGVIPAFAHTWQALYTTFLAAELDLGTYPQPVNVEGIDPPPGYVPEGTFVGLIDHEVPSSSYRLKDSDPGSVIVLARWPDTEGVYRIRFTAGYGAAADVPEDTRLAIEMTVAHWHENRESQEMPPEARRLLDTYRVLRL